MGWYPKYRNIYQSWNDDRRHHRNYSGMSGKVTIHIGDKAYPGSFSVGHTSVTIRYDGREKVLRKELGRFTKHIQNRTVYYDAYFDEDSVNTGKKANDHDVHSNSESRSGPDIGESSDKMGSGTIIGIIAVIVIVALVVYSLSSTHSPSQVSTPSGSNSSASGSNITTAYLTKPQLVSAYNVTGIYGIVPATGTISLKGENFSSFISSAINFTGLNISTPPIQFKLNTTVNAITVNPASGIKFSFTEKGQNKIELAEELYTSPQASGFIADEATSISNIYIENQTTNGMQYIIINNNRVVNNVLINETTIIANKDNYLILLECEGTLCTNKAILKTINAISMDAI